MPQVLLYIEEIELLEEKVFEEKDTSDKSEIFQTRALGHGSQFKATQVYRLG